MKKTNLLKKLNQLIDKPFEIWGLHGINLRAVSATSDGIVFSGITSDKTYFCRLRAASNDEFVIQD